MNDSKDPPQQYKRTGNQCYKPPLSQDKTQPSFGIFDGNRDVTQNIHKPDSKDAQK